MFRQNTFPSLTHSTPVPPSLSLSLSLPVEPSTPHLSFFSGGEPPPFPLSAPLLSVSPSPVISLKIGVKIKIAQNTVSDQKLIP